MYHLIINWKDGHITKMQFSVKCIADEVSKGYVKNHGDSIISITTKEV